MSSGSGASPKPGERVPPHNLAAEIAVLGSMLLDNEVIPEVVDIVRAEDFYRGEHQSIFQAINQLYEERKACDVVILGEWLLKQESPNGQITADYLISLLEAVPSSANAKYYAEIVRDLALARRLITACNEICAEAYDPSVSIRELLDSAERKILSVSLRHDTGEPESLENLLRRTFDNIDSSREGSISGLRTGFYELDEWTGGLQPSQFIVIAGRPSMGKTSLALNVAEHVALEEGVPVFFVSLEMSKEQIARNMLCSYSRVDAHSLRRNRISREDLNRFVMGGGVLGEAPIYIDDTPGITLEELRRKCRRMKARVRDLGLIIVDYLQLIQAPGSDTRQQEVAYISAGLKNLARELEVPVLALSQLSRAVESREEKRPLLSDLRESGAIEQDADVVVLIYRPEVYDRTASPGEAELIIAKQRSGPTGSVMLTFIKNYMRFENRAYETEERVL